MIRYLLSKCIAGCGGRFKSASRCATLSVESYAVPIRFMTLLGSAAQQSARIDEDCNVPVLHIDMATTKCPKDHYLLQLEEGGGRATDAADHLLMTGSATDY